MSIFKFSLWALLVAAILFFAILYCLPPFSKPKNPITKVGTIKLHNCKEIILVHDTIYIHDTIYYVQFIDGKKTRVGQLTINPDGNIQDGAFYYDTKTHKGMVYRCRWVDALKEKYITEGKVATTLDELEFIQFPQKK